MVHVYDAPASNCLRKDIACCWVAKRRALLDVWFEWIAARPHLDVAQYDKLQVPHSRGLNLLTEKHCEPQCRHNDFEAVTSDRGLGFLMIAAAGKQASLIACSDSQLYVFYFPVEKRTLAKTIQMERVTIPAISVSIGYDLLQHAEAGWDDRPRLLCHAYFMPSHVSL